ncbi:MAG: DUF3429 family protein, partial [Pseudomonadota bacterium]
VLVIVTFIEAQTATNLDWWGIDLADSISVYALLIGSFVFGTHWGVVVNNNNGKLADSTAKLILFATNFFTLVPWLVFISIEAGPVLYFALAITFLATLAIERMLYDANGCSGNYYATRKVVTIAVVLCLLLSAALSM